MRNVTKAELDAAIRGASAGDTLQRPMHYRGNLELRDRADITHLPEGLSVGGSLSLRGCTSLTHLPEGLTVGGSLYLRGCTGLKRRKIPTHLRSKVVR